MSTVAAPLAFVVGLLAAIVSIRRFLSFSLESCWPCKRAAAEHAGDAQRR